MGRVAGARESYTVYVTAPQRAENQWRVEVNVMRTSLVLFIVCAAPAVLLAQSSPAGEWQLTRDVYGNPQHLRLTLKVDGSKLSGTLGPRAIDGSVADGSIRFTIKSAESTETYTATLAGA